MDCSFCGAQMTEGWVAVRGMLPLSAWYVSLEWEPAEVRTMKKRWRDLGKRGTVAVLTGRLVRRSERGASLCYGCGAVVIDPMAPVDRRGRVSDLTGR